MKAVSTLLVVLALALGTLAASTAYLVPLSLADEELVGLTLAGPAGKAEDTDTPEPLADKEDPITPDLLTKLRGQGVTHVRVETFAWGRWPWRWGFVLAGVGLLAGAVLARLAARQELRTGLAHSASPGGSLHAAREALEGLERDLQQIEDSGTRLSVLLARLEELQKTHLAAFPEERTRLVGRLGLARYAEVMDRFAAAERQINRAWSVAADEEYGEAMACLQQAREHLGEAAAKLPGGPADAPGGEASPPEPDEWHVRRP